MIPVLVETFESTLNGSKRPSYVKTGEELVRNPAAIAVITGEWAGDIPPVTISEQLNDLRIDMSANKVTTYLFVDLDDSFLVKIPDVSKQIANIREQ
jgi:hypothetical protein